MTMSHLPPYYAYSFTPTTHTSVPSSLSPSLTPLPHPSIVVITGAGKGLGYQIALSYALAGCSGLSISSRTMADLDALETEILKISAASKKDGRSRIEVLKTVCDVTSDSSVQNLQDEVVKKWGRVDVVIANAGVISNYIPRKDETASNLPVGIVEDGDWARVLDTNINGVWRITKAFTPLLLSTPSGPQTLIVCTSLAAHSINSAATPIAYNVSKMACNRLVEHVANDHGEMGLHAYALHPGAVLTPQTQHHAGGVWDSIAYDDEDLAGAFCVWLSREKRGWLSGRYVSCNWDVGELEAKKEEIVQGELLKMRMVV